MDEVAEPHADHPSSRSPTHLTPQPAEDYAAALRRIQAIQAAEEALPIYSDANRTKLMSHGARAANVIVFLHGFTNSPEQYVSLGRRYFEQGYNIYIPRQPRHGFKTLSGAPLKGLGLEELAAFATQTADIAQGLGERVVVAGSSTGGTLTAWLAQQRADIALAAPIAPCLGIGFIPWRLTRAAAQLASLLPDVFMWWDPVRKMDNPYSVSYTYRGYYLHALLANLRLGFNAERQAKRLRPAAGRIVVITNANDFSVNNRRTAELVKLWQKHAPDLVQTYEFDPGLHIPHDMISPTRIDACVEVVYPKLLEMIK